VRRQALEFGAMPTPDGITTHWHWDPNGLGLVDDGTGKTYAWKELESTIETLYMQWLATTGGGSFRAVRVL